MLTLRRAPSVVAQAPPLDDVQLAALAHRGGVLRVLGGPGTGKTTTAIEAVVARVESGEATPDQCLILTSSGCPPEAFANASPPGWVAPRPSRSRGPTRPSGSASCGRRPRCEATRPHAC